MSTKTTQRQLMLPGLGRHLTQCGNGDKVFRKEESVRTPYRDDEFFPVNDEHFCCVSCAREYGVDGNDKRT